MTFRMAQNATMDYFYTYTVIHLHLYYYWLLYTYISCISIIVSHVLLQEHFLNPDGLTSG